MRRATRDELGPGIAEDDVDPCQQGHARWIVNDGADGVFDAVVVTVGTCGAPQWVGFPGMPSAEEIKARRVMSQKEAREGDASNDIGKNESTAESSDGDGKSERKHSHGADGTAKKGREEAFAGTLLHSSELDDAQLAGKRIVVIGSGASGVEAVETALARSAKETIIIARQDKVSYVDSCMRDLKVLEFVCVVDHPTEYDNRHAHLRAAFRARDAAEVCIQRRDLITFSFSIISGTASSGRSSSPSGTTMASKTSHPHTWGSSRALPYAARPFLSLLRL